MGADHSTQQQADRRGDAILEAVGFAAARFLRTASWEDEALAVLAHLGAATEVSRAYVFEDDVSDGEGRVARLLFEWSAPGVEPQTGNPVLQHRPMGADGWDRWERALAAGDAVHGLVRDLPAGQRAVFEPQGIVSIACVPVFVGGRWWGHMGFDDCRAERAWSERELSALRAAADVLGAAIERRRTEEGLRQAEARYRALVEQNPTITYLDSRNDPGTRYALGRTLYVSPQIEAILGWPPKDWLEDSPLWVERLHPDDRELLEEWRRHQAAGTPFRCRFRMIARDGRTVWFEENDTVVWDEHSGAELVQGVMHDITGLQEAGEQVRRRFDALEVVYRLSDAVTRAEGVEQVYDEALDGLLRAVGADRAAVLLYDEDGVMRFKAWRGLSEGYRRQAEGHSPWPRDARDPEPALVADVEEEPRLADLRETILGEGIHALGSIPLVHQGRPVGKLMAYFDAPHAFSGEDVRLAVAIAGHVAFAIERHRAEQGLREAESLYRTLTEQIPAVTFVEKWDDDWTPVYVSPGIEELSGYPVERWLESTQFWIDLVHPDDRERVLAEATRAYEEERSTSIEYRLVHADGREVWVREEDVLIRDEAGVPRFSQGIMLDITERRVAADALRASEDRYRTLAEQIPAATYVVRRDGHSTPVYWSPRIEELTGFPLERWMSSPGFWVERIHPDDRERVLAEERGSYAEQRPFCCEYRLVAADGREVWVRDENTLIRDEAGAPQLSQGIILDITERRAAAEALAASEARYRSLFEDSPIAIGIHDFSKVVARLEELVAGGVTDVAAHLEEHPEVVRECAALAETVDANHAAVELFEAGSRAELLGPVAPFFPAVALEWLRGELAGVVAGEPSHRVEAALRTVPGGHKLISMSWTPAPGHEEDLGRVWSYFQDITERGAAEEALRGSEERYRTLVEQIPAATYVERRDERSTPVYWSPRIEELTGFPPERWLGSPGFWVERIHPDDRERVLEEERSANAEQRPFMCEYRLIAADGRELWVRDENSLLRDEDGVPGFSQGIILDITERHAAAEALAASEASYRSLFEDSPIAITVEDLAEMKRRLAELPAAGPDELEAHLDAHPELVEELYGLARVLDVNQAAVELYEAGSKEELLGPIQVAFAPAAHEGLKRELVAIAAGQECFAGETVGLTLRGAERRLAMSWTAAPGCETELCRVWVYMFDVTERKAVEDALSESERRFKGAFADAGVGMTMASADGRLLHVNRAFCDMVGYAEDELLELDVEAITHQHDRAAAAAALERLMAGESDALEFEQRYVRSDDSVLWGLVSYSLVRDAEGDPAYCVAQVQDVTERKRQEERIAYLAYHDELTGLPNRTMFQEHLAMALARARRHGLALAVLYLDLDRFKLVNDSLGHAAGDAVLAQVGARLRDITRAEDMIARHSGDEFLLLLADLGAASAETAVEAAAGKAHSALREPFRVGGQEFSIDVSIGACLFPAQADNAESLVRHADMAMYESKRSGPGSTLVYAGTGRDSAGRLSLAGRLRRAIEREELELHYQPIVELAGAASDGARPLAHALGVEALIRWRDPERGLLAPAQFMTDAEDAGMSGPISDWVVEEALRQAQAMRAQGLDLAVSINLSARQLRPPLVEALCERVAAAGAEPAWLMIELTESAAMADPEVTRNVVSELSERGFRLAIDDFGAGHSSLSRLIQLDMPIEVLKLDQAFIEPIPDSEVSSTVVVGMIQVARALGMRPLAEGIETEEQMRFLIESGCELGQGFHISRPVPGSELLALAGV